MKTLFSLTFFTLLLVLASCKKDDNVVNQPGEQNAEELITTMQVILSDSAGLMGTDTFSFRDLDGPGGNAPSQFDTIRLKDSTTYFGVIQLLNESGNVVENIHEEVKEEEADHLFCFIPDLLNLEVKATDSDGTFPVGLESKWKTNEAGKGSITIRLKHQPGIKDGTCSPGETDIELQFPLVVDPQ